MKIKIILADDHPVVLAGLKQFLSGIPSVELVAAARNSTEIVEALAARSCDVLVTDFSMSGGEYGDGMAFLGFLRRRHPELKIVVFTALTNVAMASEMIALGVGAVVTKMDDISHLVAAIHAVKVGAVYLPPMLAKSVDGRHNAGKTLSVRENEVIRLYLSGLSNDEIARQLRRTKQTISAQKRSAMRKLGVDTEADLFRYAVECGIVPGGNSHDLPANVGDGREPAMR